jgi:hypothetical protein
MGQYQIQILATDAKSCGDQSGLRPSQSLRAGFSTAMPSCWTQLVTGRRAASSAAKREPRRRTYNTSTNKFHNVSDAGILIIIFYLDVFEVIFVKVLILVSATLR